MKVAVQMLSPQKAADSLKVSRQTIVNAIKAGKLNARRNNANHWIIDPADLAAWAGERPDKPPVPDAVSTPDTQTLTANDSASDSANLHQRELEVARLEAQLDAANARLADLTAQMAKQDGDHREALTKRDADYREAMDRLTTTLDLLREAQRPRGLLEWLGLRRDKPD